MEATEMILFLLGLAAAAVVAAGCGICLLVWLAGAGPGRGTEVCPPARKP